MRVGIDYRILAVGPDLISRGMGRYTQQQLRAVLALDSTNTYVLLCQHDADLSLADPEVLAAPNVEVRRFTPPQGVPGDPEVALERAEAYQQWIVDHGIDLYHATTPFLLEEPLITRFDACPMVATFYDAIPLLFPDQYLSDWAGAQQYRATLGLFDDAERLIAISKSAREDAVAHIGLPADRVDVAYPLADPCFAPLDRATVDAGLASMRRRFRLPQRFALTVTHLHHCKNLSTLLRAHARRSTHDRTELPLVVCCQLDSHGRAFLERMAAEAGVADDIVLTELVTDEELAVLYNVATLVVHPSRYEGFGLPVLEAMQAGAPVLTTTASSLPEVAGGAAELVDAEDATAMGAAIDRIWRDPDRRRLMSAAGRARAREFHAAGLGAATLAAYQAAVGQGAARLAAKGLGTAVGTGGTSRAPRRLRRIAIWTPLPPQRSGIADYSAELIDAMADRGDVDVEIFVDTGFVPEPAIVSRHRTYHGDSFARRHSRRPYDAIVYQMGGSLFHLYMYDALRRYPGIVALHDLMWSHVLYTQAHDEGHPETFVAELGRLEGDRARQELRDLDRLDPVKGQAMLWDLLTRYPMLGRVVDSSLAQIVHFDDAAAELCSHYPAARVFTVPMGVRDPGPTLPPVVAAARAALGIPAEAFVAGMFGILHPVKRVEASLDAFAGVVRDNPGAILLVVGRSLTAQYHDGLVEQTRCLGIESNVRFTGHVDRDGFDDHMAACDVVVNLRAPFMKHMSATLIRAVAAGKPVVITALEEWAFLPGEMCWRVPVGGAETAALTGALRVLAADPVRRTTMARAARAYYEKEGTIATMADRYLKVIDAVTRPSGPPLEAAPRGVRALVER